MKVLINFMGDLAEYSGISAAGHEIISARDLNPADQKDVYPELDGIISVNVAGSQMEQAPRLRVVISPVIGAERLDQETATRLGVLACNSPSPENFHGVAEATVGLIITLNKRLKRKEARLRA